MRNDIMVTNTNDIFSCILDTPMSEIEKRTYPDVLRMIQHALIYQTFTTQGGKTNILSTDHMIALMAIVVTHKDIFNGE